MDCVWSESGEVCVERLWRSRGWNRGKEVDGVRVLGYSALLQSGCDWVLMGRLTVQPGAR